MLKLIGIAVVLSGICGWVYTWKDSKDSRITNLRYMHRILTEAEYILVREKRSIIYFFEYMGNDKSTMAKVCSDVAVLLKNHTYASGSQAWERAVLDRRDSLCLDKGQTHIICMAGESFFARTAKQMSDSLSTYRIRTEKMIEAEQRKIAEQKRIVMPLSAFGGILLIIILV